MPNTLFFLGGTLLLALNSVRPFGLALSDWLYFCSFLLAILETTTIDRKNASCWISSKLLPFAHVILLGGLMSMFHSRYPKVVFVELTEQTYTLTPSFSSCWIMVPRRQREKLITSFILSGVFAAGVALFEYQPGAEVGKVFSGTA
jgi:hypothetical protein